MSEQYDFRIPTEEVKEDDLEQIVQEFSAPEFPKEQEEFMAPPVKKGASVFKVIAIVCASLILVAAVLVGAAYLQWNQRYQASLPNQKSAEAFSLLFKDPEWEMLYTLAGIEDTTFENRDTFVRYMTATAGNQRLSYMLLPQADPLTCKYAVFYNDTVIGSFTMVGTKDAIPEWSLGNVEFHLPRTHSVTIRKTPEQRAYVNGVELDDSYIIKSTYTAAEAFLPDSVHGYRLDELQVTGLLMEPLVTVSDATGVPVPMVFDSDTHTYYPQKSEDGPEIADSHVQFALDAAKANAAFAVRANAFTDLRQFFDPNSNAYEAICNTEPLLEGCASYTFDPSATDVTNYRSYGNSLFSATVTLKLDVTMENGDAHSFDLSWNYLYKQNFTGNFLIVEISEQSFHTLLEKVRFTFIQDENVVETKLVDAHETALNLPNISAPAGKVFTGWAQKHTDAQGNETMAILFSAAEGNTIQLPQGNIFEPTTLYAVYEDIS